MGIYQVIETNGRDEFVLFESDDLEKCKKSARYHDYHNKLAKSKNRAFLVLAKDFEEGNYNEIDFSEEEETRVKKILDAYGMNMSQFSNLMNIPYRTVQKWCNGSRKCPDYVIDMIKKSIAHDMLFDYLERKGDYEMQDYMIQFELLTKDI